VFRNVSSLKKTHFGRMCAWFGFTRGNSCKLPTY
jgi:hypothetical protein